MMLPTVEQLQQEWMGQSEILDYTNWLQAKLLKASRGSCAIAVDTMLDAMRRVCSHARPGGKMRFRKKTTIEATQWFKLGDHPAVLPVPSNHPAWECPEQAALCGWIQTLEGGSDGAQFIHVGDWIATGTRGEHWPIRPDIFAETYEPASSAPEGEAPLTADEFAKKNRICPGSYKESCDFAEAYAAHATAALRKTDWENSAERSELIASNAALRAERDQLKLILEQERTQLCDGVNAIKKELSSRDWLTEGRGPYEWDDDRWHAEFGYAGRDIRKALEPLEKIAADLKNCPKTHEEVVEARTNWKERAEQAERERDRLQEALQEIADLHVEGWTEAEEIARAAVAAGEKTPSQPQIAPK